MNSFNNLPYFFQISYKQTHLLCRLKPAVLIGGISDVLLKDAVEMLRILEPQVVSNLADGLVGTCYHLLGGINQFVLDVFLRGLPRLFLN